MSERGEWVSTGPDVACRDVGVFALMASSDGWWSVGLAAGDVVKFISDDAGGRVDGSDPSGLLAGSKRAAEQWVRNHAMHALEALGNG